MTDPFPTIVAPEPRLDEARLDDADRLAGLIEQIEDEWSERPDGLAERCGNALDLAIALGETGTRIGLVRRLARLAADADRTDEAIALLSGVLDLDDVPVVERANVHGDLGALLADRADTGDPAEPADPAAAADSAGPTAVEHLVTAADLFAEADEPGEAASCRTQAGTILRTNGDLAGALDHFEAARTLARTAHDAMFSAAIDDLTAEVHAARGRHDLAERLLRDALAVARAGGDPEAIGHAAWRLGSCRADHAPTDDADETLGLLAEARAGAVDRGELDLVARCDESAAVVHGANGRHDEALPLFRAALAVREALGDQAGALRVKLRLAADLAAAGDHRKAVTGWKQIAASARELGDRGLEASAVARAAGVMAERGGHRPAVDLLREVAPYFETHTDPIEAPRFHLAMGVAQLGLGNLDEARACAERAMGCLTSAMLPVTHARALELLGRCDERAGLEQEAKARFAQALALFVMEERSAEAQHLAAQLLPDPPGVGEVTIAPETTLWTGLYL